MELQLDLDGKNSNAKLRNHFGFNPGDSMCKAVATYSHQKKILKSIYICGMTIKLGDWSFHHLALLVSDAIEEKQMEEEGNLMIPQLRKMQ